MDTNVVSEPFRLAPSQDVMAWLGRQDEYDLNLTSVSKAELLVGVALMPEGKRRRVKQAGIEALLADVFGPRILPFDDEAAHAYAELVARACRIGRAVSVPDGQIGAIASVKGFTIATRDTGPFAAMGLSVINPWQSGA